MPSTPNMITTKQIKADVKRASIHLNASGLGAVINASWRAYNHSPEDRAKRIAYLREANETTAVIERSRIC